MPPVKEDDAQRETISVRNAMFVPFCLMPYVLDKDLNPREAFLLLFDIITAAKLTGCQGILDFCRVGGTLATTGAALPALARTTVGNMTAVSVSRPLIQFMKTKVLHRDFKGLIPDTTTTDPVAQQLSNAVTALTDAHIRTNEANEALREEKLEDKLIGSVYTGLRLTKLGNYCHAAPGANFGKFLTAIVVTRRD